MASSAPISVQCDAQHAPVDTKQTDLEADEKDLTPFYNQDAFGNEEFAEVKYKVLKWW